MQYKKTNDSIYDVVVIGGGPAGMIAAGRAAETGARVVLIEKNERIGKKLLITGGGRCNITNAQFDIRALVAAYGSKGKALFGPFTRFGVRETFDFFSTLGVSLKVEDENRVFPASDKAEDVCRALLLYVKRAKVEIRTSSPVTGLRHAHGRITGVKLERGEVVARNYIMATGGLSHPETGSTGEGLEFLHRIGHTVLRADSALVPIKLEESWIKKLSGLSFSAAGLSVFQNGKRHERRVGKILITHFGLSGPLVLNMSKNISELHKYGAVTLELDMYPEMEESNLDQMLLKALVPLQNKKIKNSLGGFVQQRMIDSILCLSAIDGEKEVHSVTRAERLRLVRLMKKIPLTVSGFLGPKKAIVAAGGVSLKEVDFKTMRSKIFQNLFLVGDVLDFDRPSGGYSLQLCWTTGYLAGESAGELA